MSTECVPILDVACKYYTGALPGLVQVEWTWHIVVYMLLYYILQSCAACALLIINEAVCVVV